MIRIMVVVVGMLAASCSSDSAGPGPIGTRSFELTLISGNGQTAPVGMELADSVSIGIAPGNFRIPIELAILDGGGTITLAGSTASGNGAALGIQSPPNGGFSLAYTMGETAGPNVLRVTSRLSPDTLLINATATAAIVSTTVIRPRSP